MSVPHTVDPWTELTPSAKRARIITAAISVFAERGLEAPMHEVATAAGAGVASIYRIFPSKHDLWAAIVVQRMDEIAGAFDEALAAPGDPWQALRTLVWARVSRQSPEPFAVEARDVVEDRPEVAEAVARAVEAQRRLIEAARASGGLREDATVEDLSLLFLATRAARRSRRGDVQRMCELMLDALSRT